MTINTYSLNSKDDWELLRKQLLNLCTSKTPFTLSKEEGFKRIILDIPAAESSDSTESTQP